MSKLHELMYMTAAGLAAMSSGMDYVPPMPSKKQTKSMGVNKKKCKSCKRFCKSSYHCGNPWKDACGEYEKRKK